MSEIGLPPEKVAPNSDVLTAARKLIAKPMCWTQGSYARAGKRAIPVDSNIANCFCAEGSIKRAAIDMDVSPYPASDFLNKVSFDHYGVSVISFNDTHQHDDVIELFNLAVNEARAAEGLYPEVFDEEATK